ncbi:LptA/OstA family protein [Halarsenatibacter silvermanii]|uniref:Lipopolysaccharide export system protein LptA n=1 Tax=Halarsenatibacter silvermanii TaxID=321763 RepID=A0A1G9HS39_9FIRM|nr:LptA/OstA family protein [Halarsenatibacter silvermanii]SDL15827.1 Lipopolysaccharide export system protein LptA [Halarsenatibacter silvermanii]
MKTKFSLVFALTILTIFVLVAAGSGPISAQTYRDLEGDEIYITTLEEGEYLIEARGNARLYSEGLEVTGAEADLNSLTGEVIFRENVEFDSAELFVSSRHMIYYIDEERAVFTGDPDLEYIDLYAEAEEIEYMMGENMAYLYGGVEGTRARDEFEADEVEVDLAEEKVDLLGQARVRMLDEEESGVNEEENGDEENGGEEQNDAQN